MGKVWFIGAGPGDPRLLTLRGAELLGRADVIVYDEDVHEEAFELAREDATRVRVPRGAQPESNVADLIARARSGANVARLFHGDPFAFRGGAIELAGVRKAHVEVEVVAGVIAPTAAAAYSGLALSRYEDITPSVALAVVNEAEELHDWRKLSLATDTLALMTDIEQVQEITHTLTYYGRKPETPAALVRDVSLPSQKVVLDTLVGIRKHIADFGESGMVLLVVGDSISGREALRWFDTRPLSGKRILLTRTADQGKKTAAMLRERGAEPVLVPTIEIRPPSDPLPASRAARELSSYAWVLFTSENGVHAFFGFLEKEGLDTRAFAKSRIGVIGPGTAAALAEKGLRADVIAKELRGEGLAKAILGELAGERGKRVLVARARQAREALPQALIDAGCEVDVVAVYETHPLAQAGERIRTLLEKRLVDAITFTSASTVHALCDALGEDAPALVRKSGAVVASIGPITTEAAIARGLEVGATATTSTLEGLVSALELEFSRLSSRA
ncbi:MAG TPA: uroporphyrinogen-III synthase [Polyangiaceae bacterium]|nr:uroporphyrinogen-III synthase [Polyangiaceae bacterium]